MLGILKINTNMYVNYSTNINANAAFNYFIIINQNLFMSKLK